jgi:hypothetical protein
MKSVMAIAVPLKVRHAERVEPHGEIHDAVTVLLEEIQRVTSSACTADIEAQPVLPAVELPVAGVDRVPAIGWELTEIGDHGGHTARLQRQSRSGGVAQRPS